MARRLVSLSDSQRRAALIALSSELLWVSLENNIITNIIIISIIIMIFYCAYYQQVSSSLNSTTSHPGGEPWEVGKVGQRNQDNQCLGMH